MKNGNSLIQKITDMKVIIALQAIATLSLVFFMFRVNLLPTLFMGILLVVLLILLGITFSLMAVKKQKSKRSIIGKILSLLISVVLMFSNLYIIQGGNTIDKITDATGQTRSISVIVMKDSAAKKITDLKNKKFGINSSVDATKLTNAIKDIEKQISTIKTTDYTSFETLADGLYNKGVDAIIMDEAYRSSCEEKYPDFSNETRVVYTIETHEKTKDISKDVNVTTEAFNIYISGIDTYGSVATVSRTDVNMVVTINPVTKQILMTSIPRDAYVTLASSGQKDKLTHSGIYGINESVKTVENWLGVGINYYGRVNFTSLAKIVDSLGGITVNSPIAFTACGVVPIKAGDNYLDGRESLYFVRERKTLSNGDFGRGQNQMRVLTGIINKMTSPAIITNYSSVLNSIEGSFQTNMESGDLTALIRMQLNDMSGWTIQTQQITGKGQTGGLPSYAMPGYQLYMMVPDQNSVDNAVSNIKKIENGEAVTIE